jgi:hypothetical protein
VEPVIDPEPDDAERRAILEVLEEVKAAESTLDPYRSRWREDGIREAMDASDEG